MSVRSDSTGKTRNRGDASRKEVMLYALGNDAATREAAAAEAREDLARWDAGQNATGAVALAGLRGRMEAADERAGRARGLIEKSIDGHRRAIAAGYASLCVLAAGGRVSYTVLPTLMADVTDVDELEHGVRRGGMFGAVMSFLMKLAGAVTPILSGVVLAMAGFDPGLEYEQLPTTIHRLRLMYSFVPAMLLLTALLLLVRYPLTRAKVMEIKEALRAREDGDDVPPTGNGDMAACRASPPG